MAAVAKRIAFIGEIPPNRAMIIMMNSMMAGPFSITHSMKLCQSFNSRVLATVSSIMPLRSIRRIASR